MSILFADTYNELTIKMLGYYHDHCHHYYHGSAEEVPEKFKYLITNNVKFVFIYEEDKYQSPLSFNG